MVGLVLLFGCALLTYTCENEVGTRKNVVSKHMVSCINKDTIQDKNSLDVHRCYGTSVIHVNAVDYRNDSNVSQGKRVKIRPKKYLYRNSSRQLLLTKQDYDTLLRIVEAEATGGTKKSKTMVANVVLNRVADRHFPDTVLEVVFQRGRNGVAQFSPITDGRFQRITVSKETKSVVKNVLEGEDESNGALFFLNPNTSAPSNLHWFQRNLKYLFDCGGHSFYGYKNS